MRANLNPEEFEQLELGLKDPRVTPTPPPQMPDKWGLRGAVGEGQMALNFENPRVPHIHAEGGLIPVDTWRDPATGDRAGYQREMWEIGGMHRQTPSERDWSPVPEHGKKSWITHGWENAPVERITPDMQIFSGQASDEFIDSQGDYEWRDLTDEGDGNLLAIAHNEEKVDDIYAAGDAVHEGGYTPGGQGMPPQRPWIAQIGDRRYLLEGHHRTIAARNRGTGEFDAHVIRGDSLEAVRDQLDRYADDADHRIRYGEA